MWFLTPCLFVDLPLLLGLLSQSLKSWKWISIILLHSKFMNDVSINSLYHPFNSISLSFLWLKSLFPVMKFAILNFMSYCDSFRPATRITWWMPGVQVAHMLLELCSILCSKMSTGSFWVCHDLQFLAQEKT